MKVLIKFMYRTGGKTRLVITYASPVLLGTYHYQDAVQVYTEEGPFLKKNILGAIEETIVEQERNT